MSFYDLIQSPLCYATLKQNYDMIVCDTCRCAWYSSTNHRDFHAPIHVKVCKKPDFEMVDQLKLEQCYEMLLNMFGENCDLNHNTAAILVRFYYLARVEGHKKRSKRSKFAKNLDDISFELREILRSNFRSNKILNKAWSCPGIPQFLMFIDMQSLTFNGLLNTYPTGRPIFRNSKEDVDFDNKYNVHYDSSGDWIGCFVIQFLVLSSVKSDIHSGPQNDGRGQLQSIPYAKASRTRIAGILSDFILRNSLKEALYPIPGLILNIAESHKTEFVELLNIGIFPGILEWADQEFTLKTLDIISTSVVINCLNEKNVLQILEDCCHALEFPTWQYKNKQVNDDIYFSIKNIVVSILCSDFFPVPELLLKGIDQRLEQEVPDWQASSCFGQKRMILKYFHEKLTFECDSQKITSEIIMQWIDQWRLPVVNKERFAHKVMDLSSFENWLKKCKYDNKVLVQ